MGLTVVPNATCTFCGCVCDDIELHADRERIVEARNACVLGDGWFKSHTTERTRPAALIDGREATVDEAVEAAADFLRDADLPLVYGMANITSEAQRQAVHLAELAGGVIDTQASHGHGPTIVAAQLVGKVTCTLGEVTNRADLVIYWGADPEKSHPRHLSRYTLQPTGKFVPAGRAGRTLVVVDVEETPTARLADLFLRVEPGTDFEVLTVLRALLRGRNVEVPAETGLSAAQLGDLLARMKGCRSGILFFGTGLSQTRGRHLNSAAAFALAAELNAVTKFAAMPMREYGNVTGADVVLRYTTAYPFGVSLSRGYPRYNPGEFSTVDLLTRGDVDAALVLGADPAATLPPAAVAHLGRIPTVVLDPTVTATSRLAKVHITTAASGVTAGGTVYRMDEVPLPLRPALTGPYPTDEDVLARIVAAVQ